METKKDEIRISADAMIALVVAEAEAREMAAMPSLQQMNEAFQPSGQFRQRMDRLLRRVRGKRRLRRWARAARRIALCAAVLLSVLSCMLLPVKAVREAVVTTVLDWQDQFVNVTFNAQGVDSPNLPDTVGLGYILEGFSLQEPVQLSKNWYEAIYESRDAFFHVLIMRIEGRPQIAIDNERTDFYQIQFDSHDAIWATSDKKSNTLVWDEGGFVYEIGGTIDLREMIQIAENIQL